MNKIHPNQDRMQFNMSRTVLDFSIVVKAGLNHELKTLPVRGILVLDISISSIHASIVMQSSSSSQQLSIYQSKRVPIKGTQSKNGPTGQSWKTGWIAAQQNMQKPLSLYSLNGSVFQWQIYHLITLLINKTKKETLENIIPFLSRLVISWHVSVT